ncbi:MAG: cytochrome c3 family protein [bacterium]
MFPGIFRLKYIPHLTILTTTIMLGLFPASALPQNSETDDETCLMCHDAYNDGLARTAHRLSSDNKNATVDISCVSCHEGGEMHVDDPEIGNILNPTTASPSETEATCTACHNPHTESGVIGFDPHQTQDFSCTSCHQVHTDNSSLLVDDEGEFCSTCHVSVVNQFRRRSNHPLTDQAVTCMNCHDFTGRNHAIIGHGGSSNCTACHPEQSGPFMFEHRATTSFSTEGDGCTACHQPHGSPNERLLTQNGSRLCMQCHGVPPQHRTKHGGIGSQFACIECHSDIHGSHISRTLLDPQLGARIGGAAKSCFCHNIDG